MAYTYRDVNPNYGQSKYGELVTDVLAINASIENILGTELETRVMLPEFGSSLRHLLFEPMNRETAFQIYTETIIAVQRWEPRVNIIQSESTVLDYPDENYYEVNLVYEIIRNGLEGIFNRLLIRD